MTDESLFPLRCCKQSIPTGDVRIFLTSELIDQYELKKVEFGTTNRPTAALRDAQSFSAKRILRATVAPAQIAE